MIQIKADYRLGGVPQYYMARDGEVDRNMQVPDEIRKCVVFVCIKNKDDIIVPRATAFFAFIQARDTEPPFTYLVTAKHVIDNASTKSKDGKIWLRLNKKDGSCESILTERSDWIDHPDDDSVDVAVMRVNETLFLEFDHLPFCVGGQRSMVVTDELINKAEVVVGDEVFLPGLFVNHYGEDRNLPILRVGNIALMPAEKIETKIGYIDAYLVEARSIGGHSGSPVFVYFGDTRMIKDDVYHGGFKRAYWLGLMHGHYEIKDDLDLDAYGTQEQSREKMNMGIAIVVPAEKVLEVINQEVFVKERKKISEQIRSKNLPVMDSETDQKF